MTKHKEKLLETINSSGLNKIFEFKLPGALKDVYQNEMDRIVANIIEDKIMDKPVQKKEAIEPSNSMSESNL